MHKIEYYLLKSLYHIFTILPFGLVEQIANVFAFLLQHVVRYRHDVIVNNLKNVYGTDLPMPLDKMLKEIYRNFTYLWFEVLQTKKIKKANAHKHFQTFNKELVETEFEKDKGLILITGHLGNFEWLSIYLGIEKLPFAAIAKRIKNGYIDTFMRENRERNGCTVIYTKTAMREGLRFLRDKKVLAIAADQDARKKGVFVDFLGIPSSTAVGPAIFQIRSGAPLVFIAAIRTGYASFNIYYDKIDIEAYEKMSDIAIKEITQAHTAVLDIWIRKYPTQYFWVHKRWKSKPQPEPATEH